MKRVLIGVYVAGDVERLSATLESVRNHTTEEYDLLLLLDGISESARQGMRGLGGLPSSATHPPEGTAACFNRLCRHKIADIYVLLENGSLVGPGWLTILLRALNADPANGLAGPSTNLCWNEQAVLARAAHTPAAMTGLARSILLRYGQATRTLKPLYSLADFCYTVRHEVVAAVGAADEAYGLGPCWEMDYNIRAARAGFRGVWACGAYVHRRLNTQRAQQESAHFEAARHRYQDKFCGLRLRGETVDYEPHCRGEECEHFAPGKMIQIYQPFARSAPIEASRPATVVEVGPPASPSVTCIMPTFNRRAFVPSAVRYFQRQDYPDAELLILDDGSDPVEDCISPDRRIRYVRLKEKLTIGAKRNLACLQSHGAFIVHWDDDDWQSPDRIRRQVEALIQEDADVCGSSRVYYYDPAQDQSWLYEFRNRQKPWLGGNTLAYRRSFWERIKFPEVQIGEDARFLWTPSPRKLLDLADPALSIGMIHSSNASPKDTKAPWWQLLADRRVQQLLGTDLKTDINCDSLPLITCIMPTRNRRSFVRLALEHFNNQDYPSRELIVVDDGEDLLGDLAATIPGVSYVQLNPGASIGYKRNLAVQNARGSLIAHWDDDDWYAPGRLRYQASPILAGVADITGLVSNCILDLCQELYWRPSDSLHREMFVGDVHGGTLLYRKSLWQQGVRYPETNLAEDAMLIRRALQRGMRLERMSDPSMFIYMRHNCNAWQFAPGEFLQPEQWSQVEAPPSFRQILLYKEAQSQAASYALASGNRQISTPRSIGKSKIHSPDGNVGWSLASASENR